MLREAQANDNAMEPKADRQEQTKSTEKIVLDLIRD